MRDKLKWYHFACREMTCTFLGHDTISSWRKRKNFDELTNLPYKELPYRLREGTGNPYFEYGSWWSFKCRRCRKRVRAPERMSESIITQLKYFLKFGVPTSVRSIQFVLTECRGWTRFFLIPPLFVAELCEEFFVYVDSAWEWPGLIFSKITHWIYERLDDPLTF